MNVISVFVAFTILIALIIVSWKVRQYWTRKVNFVYLTKSMILKNLEFKHEMILEKESLDITHHF